MNCGCRDMAGVIGPLLEGAEVSDEGIADDESADALVALPHAVYTSVQMLKNTPKTAISATFRDLRRGLQAGRLARQHVTAS